MVDIDTNIAQDVAEKYNVPCASSIDNLLQKIDNPTIAIVALPHNEYLPVIRILAQRGIHIIKEKPFAISLEKARELFRLAKEHNVSIQVTLQRRYNPIFKTFCQLAKRIGTIHTIEARYTLNIKDLSEGWRSKKDLAGGGALIDMGYHYIDLFIWYFGVPEKIKCRMSSGNRPNQDYDVEDTALLDFTYENADRKILATLFVSRVHSEKKEGLTAHGQNGSVTVTRGRVARYNVDGEMIEELQRTHSWPSAIIDQLETLISNISSGSWRENHDQYLDHTIVLDASYASAASGKEIETKTYFNNFR